MSDVDGTIVPVWALSTAQGSTASITVDEGTLSPERLDGLRSALAAFASVPLVTLEAHPLPVKRERETGLPLDAMSPLAQELSRLLSSSAHKVPAVARVADSPEVLYRMVVPAKVASQFGTGLLKPMASRNGGMYGDLVATTGKKLITAKASFVPVEAASAGATGTVVGAAAGTTAAGAALTVAAPLVLMAVAVSASAYADHQRHKAIENITELLEKLHDDKLEAERSELDGCRDAIDKATALLLDHGKVGASLGLDSAVHAISTATQQAERRVKKWEAALDTFVDGHVDIADLEATFPGVTEPGGEFRAHLELVALAIALKRRVVVLQGVEAGQSDRDNPFENFVRSLRDDQQRINTLEERVQNVLRRLSGLKLRSPRGLTSKVGMLRRQVDSLLDTAYRLRSLSPEHSASTPHTDVVIEIEKHSDGTLLVLPAHAS